ncbi:DUF3168 domain-containing protein [Larkinella humicola]|uniref:DUF3168 domain-containing protein n=1 Tax=Larkinella humicola TaxID=2607654 RepID=A0A5N1JNP6_9BACT|nr:DUF3168 domain-containing protein [Larkinella humicola]KAA9357236.1 DUF3168 domain-containing protein [Larkinella humicola]
MIGDAIYHILTNDPGVTAQIGENVFPNLVPQGQSTTAAWYDTEEVTPLNCRDARGSFSGTIEIGVISPDFDKMILTLRAVRKSLDNYRGVAAGISVRFFTGTEGQAGYDDTLKLHGKSLRWNILGQILTP